MSGARKLTPCCTAVTPAKFSRTTLPYSCCVGTCSTVSASISVTRMQRVESKDITNRNGWACFECFSRLVRAIISGQCLESLGGITELVCDFGSYIDGVRLVFCYTNRIVVKKKKK
eukprot:110396_1